MLVLAVLVLPAGTPAIHGCSDELPFESACRWLADPENCFREFHEDMVAARGPDNLNGDCRTYPPFPVSTWPTEASQAGPGVSNGAFQSRAKLDTCILTAGGMVTVNPPIDLTMYPPTGDAGPVMYTLSFVNPDGNECGHASYTSPYSFSITIDAPPDAGMTAMADGSVNESAALVDAGPQMDDTGTPIPFGTYTQVNPPGRDAFDVTCPSGEAHHFTLDEINVTNPNAGLCPRFAGIVPSASLQLFLGGVDVQGALSFAIVYPPWPTSGSEAYPDAGPPLDGDRVVYFNCSIPAALETCMDGVKDGNETDLDCGGPQLPSVLYCGTCPARCQVMQQCICDGDCDEHLVCAVNTMSGMRQCTPQDAGVANDFPACSYTDPPLPCGDAGADAPADVDTSG
jgi:hypothetical protein